MKKLVRVLALIIILAIIMGSNVVNAASSTMKLTVAESNIKVGDTINIYLSLEDFQDIAGLTAIGGFLSYDSSILEYQSISSENGWSSVNYNATNGKFITTQDSVKGKGNVFKVTFKVLAKPTTDTTVVAVTNFDVTDDETDGIQTADVSVTFSIAEKTPTVTPPPDDGKNEVVPENVVKNEVVPENVVKNEVVPENVVKNETIDIPSTQKPSGNTNKVVGDPTTAGDKLPQTGTIEAITIGLITAIAIVSIITFIKYKNTKLD